jgi:RNA polymerase sigma factor (sigma-70 family)
MEPLAALVRRAQAGDLKAFGDLVHATQSKVYALARSVLHDPALAEDAAQQAFLRAFRRLGELQEPEAFAGWLRRVTLTVALNIRRGHRTTLLRLDDVPEVPVLDEAESRWSDLQRHRLSAALLSLSSEDRQVCDRRWFRVGLG